MNGIRQLIETLRARNDIGVIDEAQSWLISITNESDLICEVTIPHDVLEWYASVKHRQEKKELWSDWMDYSGYDDPTSENAEAEMSRDILAFINRVSSTNITLPLKIYDGGA